MSIAPVRTTCPYCGVGCGVIATQGSDGAITIAGDPEHPANRGRLCSKGSALGETLIPDGRLLHPEIRGRRVSWDAALGKIANGLSRTIADHGPDSVALYVSGQLLTEDYYAANKLMKGYIGTANIDTNSRLCMASSVAGHKRAFGSDTVPGCYEDFEQADVVVLVGSNLAWCHPVLYQRLAAARAERGTKVVVIDPRRTATCEIADLHLPIAPGTDVAIFNGLLAAISASSSFDREYVSRHTVGFDAALVVARRASLDSIARIAGVTTRALHDFYELFVRTELTVTAFSQGVNQSSSGTEKVNAIINCHLATGRIGKPGMGPFSITGQPNAMGGREVGGLANMLAAHMDLDNPSHRQAVQSFWSSPRIADKAGLKAVEMFEAVRDGRIKALWIMATNPAVSMPEADRVREALRKCPLVVVSDVDHTDTTEFADVLLPSAAWGEKDGTVTNSERRISRQRAFLTTVGDARPDWWQIAEVAKLMGFEAGFSWSRAADIFVEHARLTGIQNSGSRDFDISADAAIAPDDYDALAPFQWPHPTGTDACETRFFSDGNFFTPDRRARFVPTKYRALDASLPKSNLLILNTGRIRDQWHTMTRTAKAARLNGHIAEPFVEINPIDAVRAGVSGASLATIESDHGAVVMRVLETVRARPGSIFAPIHWTDQFASNARIGALIKADVDPVSGQPALKQMPVKVSPYPARWFAFATGVPRPHLEKFGYWALARTRAGWSVELADATQDIDGAIALDMLWPAIAATHEILSYCDSTRGEDRFAIFDGARLKGALFISRSPVACARTFITDQIGAVFDDSQQRHLLLAGRAGAGTRDKGPTVCACFEVGRIEIVEAIESGRAATVDAVGQATRAGTNCGACRAEIGGLIRVAARPRPTEVMHR